MRSSDCSIAASVAQYGWTAVGVDDRSPSYLYSVGLATSADHPEIVICGLKDEGLVLLKLLVYLIASGESFAREGVYTHVLEGVPLAVRHVHVSHVTPALEHAIDHFEQGDNLYRFAAVQVFWPDDAGRFPFEDDCSPEVAALQMRLDLPRVTLTPYEVR